MSPALAWLALLAAALLGPPLIGIAYVIAVALGLDPTFGYVLFVGCLVAYAVVGTRRSEGDVRRTLFALLTIVASLFAMFVAFFSQMAA